MPVTKSFPLRLAGLAVLLLAASRLTAASPIIAYGGENYALTAVHEPRNDKDQLVMLLSPADNAGREVKTVIEVSHWAKKKYPDELGQGWLQVMFPRCVEKPAVIVSPHDKRDLIYETISFFQNPNGQECALRRFFREPGGGVTSYLVKWLFLEHDSKVDDAIYRSRRDALIKELQGLRISLALRPEAAPPRPAAPAPATGADEAGKAK